MKKGLFEMPLFSWNYVLEKFLLFFKHTGSSYTDLVFVSHILIISYANIFSIANGIKYNTQHKKNVALCYKKWVKQGLQTSKVSEILINKQTFNNGLEKIQKILLDSQKNA